MRVLSAMALIVVVAGCATSPSGAPSGREHLGDVHFPMTGSADIQRVDRSRLDQLAAALRDDPKASGFLTGHAYDYSSRAHNMSMGSRRAEAAAKYVASLGVDRGRISTTSRGDADPRVSPSNLRERRMNNRVGVYLVKGASE